MPIQRIIALSSMLQCHRSCTVLNKKVQQINKYRQLTLIRSKHVALKNEKEKFRNYIVQRYLEYVNNYTKALENRFPTAMNMYRVFSIGTRDFLRDLKMYISLRIKIVRDKGFSNMTRQEIELYEKMPLDMKKIAPVLILSAVPFGNYVIFPLAFWKPKSLLCSHFWSIQQKAEFSILDLKERLKNNKPVFRALQAKLDSIPDGEIKKRWRKVIALLGSGVHPTPQDVLACKDLFVKEPYQLNSLSYSHKGYLLKMHGLRKSLVRTNKLKFKALLLLEMDKAIIREGGIEHLSSDVLRNACHIRGLNGSHLTNKDMKDWLEKWLMISGHIDKSSYSLLLHCPIFFAYNDSQNWVLIY